jgi:CBS domain containing-hemolysin-like protein
MLSLIFAIILLVIILCLISTIKLINYLPEREIKRRTDSLSIKIKQLIIFKNQTETSLYIIIAILSALDIFILVKSLSTLDGLVIVIILFLIFVGLVRSQVGKIIRFLGKIFLSLIIKIIYKLNKKKLINKSVSEKKSHTGIYDLNDVDELIERQLTQDDNRILKEDLKRIKNLINLEKYSVSSFIIDKDYYPVIEPKDLITPIIIDDVKKTDRPFLPVTLDGEIVGIVPEEIFVLKNNGHIEDFMDSNIKFISNRFSLLETLSYFINSKKDYLVVQDDYNSYLGLVYLRDIVNWIFVLEV